MRLHVTITEELEAFLNKMEQEDPRNTHEYIIARALGQLKVEEDQNLAAAQEEAEIIRAADKEIKVQERIGPLKHDIPYRGPLKLGKVEAKPVTEDS